MIWFGGREVVFGKLTPGGLIAFWVYCHSSCSLSHISNGIQALQQSLASAERILKF